MWPGDGTLSFSDITDGTSHTVMLVVVPCDDFNWFEPTDLLWDGERLVFENDTTKVVEFSQDAPGMLIKADGSQIWIYGSLPQPDIFSAMLGHNDGIPIESLTMPQDFERLDD